MGSDEWAAERGKFAGHTVLVVDDEHDSRFLLRHHLTDFGLRVIMAENGREGIEVAKAHQPDLITLDLEMPDMDGWEALRRMKADPSIRHIPVVIASIRADEGRVGAESSAPSTPFPSLSTGPICFVSSGVTWPRPAVGCSSWTTTPMFARS